jgi:hypothetical protein
MPLAVWSNLGPIPVAPAVPEPEAGEARHQVELRGPGVADLDRVESDLLISDDYVLALQPLAHGVMLRNLQTNPLVRHSSPREGCGRDSPKHSLGAQKSLAGTHFIVGLSTNSEGDGS